jgi:hypothetical protein
VSPVCQLPPEVATGADGVPDGAVLVGVSAAARLCGTTRVGVAVLDGVEACPATVVPTANGASVAVSTPAAMTEAPPVATVSRRTRRRALSRWTGVLRARAGSVPKGPVGGFVVMQRESAGGLHRTCPPAGSLL